MRFINWRDTLRSRARKTLSRRFQGESICPAGGGAGFFDVVRSAEWRYSRVVVADV